MHVACGKTDRHACAQQQTLYDDEADINRAEVPLGANVRKVDLAGATRPVSGAYSGWIQDSDEREVNYEDGLNCKQNLLWSEGVDYNGW